MINYNEYFNIEDHIGQLISELEFQVLMADGMLWVTRCFLTGIEAAKAMKKDVSEFAVQVRAYGGLIYASDLKEAEQCAINRGYGEEVLGVLHGTFPFDSDNINYFDTSKNIN